MVSRKVLDSNDIDRAITRIAHEILERNRGSQDLVLIGIPTRWIHLAERLAVRIERIDKFKIPVGILDITLHRDDLRKHPLRNLVPTRMPTEGIDQKKIVLVDDVLFSGRTIRAALDAIGEYGRPAQIQLAVLVDRGHRELPIRADYVGKNLPTRLEEHVTVNLLEIDDEDSICIETSSS